MCKQFSKNKTMATLITIILLLSTAISLASTPTARAHPIPWQIPTYAFVNVSPNPAGVGQQCLVVVWLDKIPDGALVTNNIRFHNYKCLNHCPWWHNANNHLGYSNWLHILSIQCLYPHPNWYIHIRLYLSRTKIHRLRVQHSLTIRKWHLPSQLSPNNFNSSTRTSLFRNKHTIAIWVLGKTNRGRKHELDCDGVQLCWSIFRGRQAPCASSLSAIRPRTHRSALVTQH